MNEQLNRAIGQLVRTREQLDRAIGQLDRTNEQFLFVQQSEAGAISPRGTSEGWTCSRCRTNKNSKSGNWRYRTPEQEAALRAAAILPHGPAGEYDVRTKRWLRTSPSTRGTKQSVLRRGAAAFITGTSRRILIA
ncbi:MAG TPA: hypothetical protein VE974_20540 [Thermoanaerobaculia bacterium]|nr:hypothetical protein [Thermoanaerobaculia bacterium]